MLIAKKERQKENKRKRKESDTQKNKRKKTEMIQNDITGENRKQHAGKPFSGQFYAN